MANYSEKAGARVCVNCGRKSPWFAGFCGACGRAFVAAPPVVAPPVLSRTGSVRVASPNPSSSQMNLLAGGSALVILLFFAGFVSQASKPLPKPVAKASPVAVDVSATMAAIDRQVKAEVDAEFAKKRSSVSRPVAVKKPKQSQAPVDTTVYPSDAEWARMSQENTDAVEADYKRGETLGQGLEREAEAQRQAAWMASDERAARVELWREAHAGDAAPGFDTGTSGGYPASAGGYSSSKSSSGGSVSVRGYTRKDGTYVKSYTRRSPRH